jgi:predicted dehydrogenase
MSQRKSEGISRRDFARASAMAGFAILTSCQTTQPTRTVTSSETLKVGLLGCGNRGTGAAVNMLEGNPNVKLVALADLFEDRLKAAITQVSTHKNPHVREKYAVAPDHCFIGWDAYKKILATDIDIIIEGTLPYSRPKHVEAAVQAKKHIFTEKPIAPDPVVVSKGFRLLRVHNGVTSDRMSRR